MEAQCSDLEMLAAMYDGDEVTAACNSAPVTPEAAAQLPTSISIRVHDKLALTIEVGAPDVDGKCPLSPKAIEVTATRPALRCILAAMPELSHDTLVEVLRTHCETNSAGVPLGACETAGDGSCTLEVQGALVALTGHLRSAVECAADKLVGSPAKIASNAAAAAAADAARQETDATRRYVAAVSVLFFDHMRDKVSYHRKLETWLGMDAARMDRAEAGFVLGVAVSNAATPNVNLVTLRVAPVRDGPMAAAAVGSRVQLPPALVSELDGARGRLQRRIRTETADIDMRGRPCKERMMRAADDYTVGGTPSAANDAYLLDGRSVQALMRAVLAALETPEAAALQDGAGTAGLVWVPAVSVATTDAVDKLLQRVADAAK